MCTVRSRQQEPVIKMASKWIDVVTFLFYRWVASRVYSRHPQGNRNWKYRVVDISVVIRGEVWLQEPVREALEGARCVLGALQFGNDPGFSKHDWDADGYICTESFSCTSLPPNPSSQVSSTPSTSKLTDLADHVFFPPSLPSTPDVSSTSSELTDLVLFPPSLPSTLDVSSLTSSELTDLVDSVLFPPSLPSTPDDSSLTSSELTDLVDSVLFPPSLPHILPSTINTATTD